MRESHIAQKIAQIIVEIIARKVSEIFFVPFQLADFSIFHLFSTKWWVEYTPTKSRTSVTDGCVVYTHVSEQRRQTAAELIWISICKGNQSRRVGALRVACWANWKKIAQITCAIFFARFWRTQISAIIWAITNENYISSLFIMNSKTVVCLLLSQHGILLFCLKYNALLVYDKVLAFLERPTV